MTLTLHIHRVDTAGHVAVTPEVKSFDGEHLGELSCYHKEDKIQREGRTFTVVGRVWTEEGGLTLVVHERVVAL